MESMDPGQLSITLYSVCKIQDLNTASPLWMFIFFPFFSFSPCLLLNFLSIVTVSYFLIVHVLEACERRLVLVALTNKNYMRN